ncbi:MAG: hypothetical protein HYY37_01815 [Candidatus Aenigmarchaeota archaeon]|nr:hypothetical protein [Candidatus Aenigmarchaeota archaeon]
MIFSFTEKHWKQLIAVPFVLLIAASVLLVHNVVTKGSFLERDVELRGGKIIEAEIRGGAGDMPGYAHVRTAAEGRRVLIEIPAEQDENEVLGVLRSSGVLVGEPTVRTFGPSLGEVFWKQAQIALLVAFVAMSVFVFILFRSPVPSLIVILAATTDIVVTIAVLSMLGVQLSLSVLAALLMIIGYSVDTDILLTSNLLRHGGDTNAKIRSSMITGLTMSLTALAALSAMYLFAGSFVLSQMALVLIIGIVVDIPATWFANAGLLRWWMMKRA